MEERTNTVKVTVNDDTSARYYVLISWEDLNFVYNTNAGTWNPDPNTQNNHQYTGASHSWESNTKTITVTNHSNADVWVKGIYEAKADNTLPAALQGKGLTVTLSDANTYTLLENDATNGDGTCAHVNYTLTISNTSDLTTGVNTTEVGTVKIVVSKVNPL
ncbi:MAG: hypothetical protein IJC68_04330 [Firmicutes bacterium]|nr:hypothetical protein [Bacillota bacterium]